MKSHAMKSQAAIFLAGEADAYYQRNQDAYRGYTIEDDVVAEVLRREVSPDAQAAKDPVDRLMLIDLGCASGERLSGLCRRYAALGVGIDASTAAIQAARDRDPAQSWWVGDWSKGIQGVSALRGAAIVITSYVWHWMDRSRIIRAMDAVNDCVRPGGYLVINDFYPDQPIDVPYVHTAGVTTFKRRYEELFLATGTYRRAQQQVYPYHGAGETCSCMLLQRMA